MLSILRSRASFAAVVAGLGLLSVVNANAALVSVLGGQAINDTDLNVTWLADANYAQTSGYSANGLMTWNQAQNWIASLNAENGGAGHLGYNDWRLPVTGPVNGVSMSYIFQYDGSSDVGYNISAPGTTYAGSKNSEMAYLFYNGFGWKGAYNTTGGSQGLNLFNDTGLFINFQGNLQYSSGSLYSDYWSATEYTPDTGNAWGFSFIWGAQGYGIKDDLAYALAVRTGQVVVPLPAALWLLGSGLLCLICVAHRRKAI